MSAKVFCDSSLSPIRFIRKMRGGAQSILVECDSGHHLIVKMQGNPQGPNVLANEFLGTYIASSAGLPVPEGYRVCLSEQFIDQNPGMWFETQYGRRIRPGSGLHFGASFVGELQGDLRPTEYIARSRVSSIANRSAFLGMYIMDVWANHQDNRQALLLQSRDSHRSTVFFVDHGHMFAGPHWNFSDLPGAVAHLERSIYADLCEPNHIAHWLSHFEEVLPGALSEAFSILPKHWYKGSIDVLQDRLLQRLSNLEHLLEVDRKGPGQMILGSKTDGTLQIPRLGLHMLGAAV